MVALVCGGSIFFAIYAFDRPTPYYNRLVADQILFAATLIFFPLWYLNRADWKFDDRRPLAWLVAGALVSTMLAPVPWAALSRLHLYYAAILFTLSLRLGLRQSSEGAVPLVLFAVSLVHMVFLLLVLMSQTTLTASFRTDELPNFANIRHLAYQGFFSACAGTALGYMNNRLRLAGILMAVLSLFGLFIFGSRGATASWLIFVIVAAWFHLDRKRVIGISVIVLAGAITLAAVANQQHYFLTQNLIDRAFDESAGVIAIVSDAGRFTIWREALSASLSSPVFGYGPEGFLRSHCCSSTVVQPHNALIQILIEFGFVGLVFFMWNAWGIFGNPIKRLLASEKENSARGTLFAILVAATVYSMVDGLIYHAVPVLHLAIFSALFLEQMQLSLSSG